MRTYGLLIDKCGILFETTFEYPQRKIRKVHISCHHIRYRVFKMIVLGTWRRYKFSERHGGLCCGGVDRNSWIIDCDVVRIEAHVLGIDTGLSYGGFVPFHVNKVMKVSKKQ